MVLGVVGLTCMDALLLLLGLPSIHNNANGRLVTNLPKPLLGADAVPDVEVEETGSGTDGGDRFTSRFDEAGKIKGKFTYPGYRWPRFEKALGVPLEAPTNPSG